MRIPVALRSRRRSSSAGSSAATIRPGSGALRAMEEHGHPATPCGATSTGRNFRASGSIGVRAPAAAAGSEVEVTDEQAGFSWPGNGILLPRNARE
jgi:hypothetical protein